MANIPLILLPLLKRLANSFLVITVQSLADLVRRLCWRNFDVLASQIYFYLVGTQLIMRRQAFRHNLLGFSLLFFLIQYWWMATILCHGIRKGYRGTFQPLPSGLKSLIFCILAVWSVLPFCCTVRFLR
ncbi:iron(III) transport system permease [Actinobacillus pleuropneumoniae]|nr:iron(III) transport system permease [Actinobacillus pleuropneumoniae]